MKYAKLGTVSHGTFVTHDLLEAFAGMLSELIRTQETDDYDPEHTHAALVAEFENLPEDYDYDCENAHLLLESLTDALDVYSPPYCRFGSHEGNGSDFGFWLCQDEYDAAVRDGDIIVLPAGTDPNNIPASYFDNHKDFDWSDVSWIAFVNDHGNISLHSIDRTIVTREMWAVV